MLGLFLLCEIKLLEKETLWTSDGIWNQLQHTVSTHSGHAVPGCSLQSSQISIYGSENIFNGAYSNMLLQIVFQLFLFLYFVYVSADMRKVNKFIELTLNSEI